MGNQHHWRITQLRTMNKAAAGIHTRMKSDAPVARDIGEDRDTMEGIKADPTSTRGDKGSAVPRSEAAAAVAVPSLVWSENKKYRATMIGVRSALCGWKSVW